MDIKLSPLYFKLFIILFAIYYIAVNFEFNDSIFKKY